MSDFHPVLLENPAYFLLRVHICPWKPLPTNALLPSYKSFSCWLKQSISRYLGPQHFVYKDDALPIAFNVCPSEKKIFYTVQLTKDQTRLMRSQSCILPWKVIFNVLQAWPIDKREHIKQEEGFCRLGLSTICHLLLFRTLAKIVWPIHTSYFFHNNPQYA